MEELNMTPTIIIINTYKSKDETEQKKIYNICLAQYITSQEQKLTPT